MYNRISTYEPSVENELVIQRPLKNILSKGLTLCIKRYKLTENH